MRFSPSDDPLTFDPTDPPTRPGVAGVLFFKSTTAEVDLVGLAGSEPVDLRRLAVRVDLTLVHDGVDLAEVDRVFTSPHTFDSTLRVLATARVHIYVC